MLDQTYALNKLAGTTGLPEGRALAAVASRMTALETRATALEAPAADDHIFHEGSLIAGITNGTTVDVGVAAGTGFTAVGGLYDLGVMAAIVSGGNAAGFVNCYIDGVLKMNIRFHTNGGTHDTVFSQRNLRLAPGAHTVTCQIAVDAGGLSITVLNFYLACNRRSV